MSKFFIFIFIISSYMLVAQGDKLKEVEQLHKEGQVHFNNKEYDDAYKKFSKEIGLKGSISVEYLFKELSIILLL